MSYPYAIPFAAVLAVCAPAAAENTEEPFSFATVKQMAEQAAAVQHQPPQRAAEQFLKLDYDGYRMIAAERANALWRDAKLPFWAEFFPAGFIYEYPVEINTVDQSGRVERLSPDGNWFQFRSTSQSLAGAPGRGFSGLRLLGQLAPNTEMDEFLVFQGASYFRGREAPFGYGVSARALAIDVGLTSPEEFPRFQKFWLERPKKDAASVRVWGLIDSPAEAGACQFTITPGKPLTIDVQTEVWFRHHVQKVGVAPMTSMWMWDASTAHAQDPRPEVHDSDGLLIQTKSGGSTWRPLARPKTPQVDRIAAENLAGFGLLQRDRNADHYRDAEAKYHERPSAWVTPTNDWGIGHVELLELPAENEGVDNIGAYWVPDRPIEAGSHLAVNYRLTFGESPSEPRSEWKITDTRVEKGVDAWKFEVEFTNGKSSVALSARPLVSCDQGAIEDLTEQMNDDGQLLVRFTYRPASAQTAHIQAQLGTGTKTVSEKWSYLWTRE